MSRILTAICVCAAVALASQSGARANGIPVAPPVKATTPADRAVVAYNAGIEHRNRALKAEAQAVRTRKGTARSKHESMAREEHGKALGRFAEAAGLDPALPQAWNGMGFAHRKLGDYTRALEAYERALALAPRFADAIEYRAEAYLALNRIDDAKQSYLALFAIDRQQADVLMSAMTAWVTAKKADPAGADPAVVAALEAWIQERSLVAQQTRLMGHRAAAAAW